MFNLEFLKDILKRNILAILGILFGIVSFLISIGIIFYNRNTLKENKEEKSIPVLTEKQDKETEEIKDVIKVDVKGAVKKPGVYELNIGSNVLDAISIAGGVNSKGTTTNINLAKKLADEMVVYVFTKAELETKKSTNEIVCAVPKCDCETITVDPDYKETKPDTKISINTGSLEELMTLDGIGEAKAKAIIEYREQNGNYKVLEDLMKVSGIGASAFENIKEKIEL